MSSIFLQIRKHWFTLALLVGSIIGVRLYVAANRIPGSVTVIEAQSMDMSTMKAPVGLAEVTTEIARTRGMGESFTLPATIKALSDEDVVVRIAGRVSRILVYPGDEVHAGQLLAELDAPDVAATADSAREMANSKGAEVLVSHSEVVHHHHLKNQAAATAKQSSIAAERAQIDAETTDIAVTQAQSEVKRAASEVADKVAEFKAILPMVERQRSLYKQGAIALEELQQTIRDKEQGDARLNGARANQAMLEQSVSIAQKRQESAHRMVDEAKAGVVIAKIGIDQADEALAQAKSMEAARQYESAGARASASSTQSVSGFRHLVASSSGVVSERVVSPGTAVMPGQVVLRIQSVEYVRVQVEVPIVQTSMIHIGSSLELLGEDKSRTLTITSIFPDADPQSRTVRVEALITNPGHRLHPGQFARVKIMASGPQQLTIPTDAVVSASDGNVVWVAAPAPVTKDHDATDTDWTCTMHPQVSLKGPGKCPICKMDLVKRIMGSKFIAARRVVSVGSTQGKWVEVNNGIRAGDRVITSGQTDLTEGTALKIKDAQ